MSLGKHCVQNWQTQSWVGIVLEQNCGNGTMVCEHFCCWSKSSWKLGKTQIAGVYQGVRQQLWRTWIGDILSQDVSSQWCLFNERKKLGKIYIFVNILKVYISSLHFSKCTESSNQMVTRSKLLPASSLHLLAIQIHCYTEINKICSFHWGTHRNAAPAVVFPYSRISGKQTPQCFNSNNFQPSNVKVLTYGGRHPDQNTFSYT